MPDDRRQRSPGRRESDRILDALWRELDALHANSRREFDRLEQHVGKLEDHLDERVDQLEAFHISERAKIGERVRERTVRAETWAKVSIGFGVLGTLWGIVATVIHL